MGEHYLPNKTEIKFKHTAHRYIYLSILIVGCLIFIATSTYAADGDHSESKHADINDQDASGHSEGHHDIHDDDHGDLHDSAAIDGHDSGHETDHPEGHDSGHGEFHAASVEMSKKLPLWTGIPFVGILLSIALFPLLAPHFWHHHFPKISAFWALIFIIPFLFTYKGLALYEIIHIYLIDYIPFIILLWGLYTVSGGILLRGSLVGTPIVNLIMILVGTLLASWMGTTGAAMLMIRPLLRANQFRKTKMHVVIFFIFLVANIGGSLTPLGDPPLFLGFLHGVPFFWTFKIMPHFLLASVLLMVVFFVLDTILYRRENPQINPDGEKEAIRLEGGFNFLFLGGIVGLVLLSGTWKAGHTSVYEVQLQFQNVVRDLGIVCMGLLSLWATSKKLREDNEFSWFPIQEVAYLFAGIFATIIPMLAMLRAGTDGAMAALVDQVSKPIHYFWITGILSAFLDNAPTYLTFFNFSLGRMGLSEATAAEMLRGMVDGREAVAATFVANLKAISAGAVFFGAFSYIGNAPNFMVRSIAEESGLKMPSFFGFILWSLVFLVPVFIVITLVFF